jgi:S1-C subfamily serine protease
MFSRPLLGAALGLAASGALAANGFAWHSQNTLRWRSQGQYLHLSTDKGGVVVIALTPDNLWGLRKGDVIVSADGAPVSNVDALFAGLRAHDSAPLPLVVRRNGAEQPLPLAAEARAGLLHEPPPAPPAPPPPPHGS